MEIEKVRILEDLQSRFAVDVAGIYNRFSYIVDAWSGEKDPYRYDDIAEFVDEKFPDMSDQIERIEGEYSDKAAEVDADAIEYSDRRNFFTPGRSCRSCTAGGMCTIFSNIRRTET